MKYLRCLVLGGRGFLGSHIVEALLARGVHVRILDRPAPAGAKLFVPKNADLMDVVEGDFTNHQDLMIAMADCDVCVHAVTTTLPKTSNDDIEFDVSTNLIGTIKLLEHAAKTGLRKLIFLSSGGTVYGTPTVQYISETHATEPISSYGITKLAIEKYLRLFDDLHGLKSVSLRISNPYGPRQRIDGAQGAVAVFLGAAFRRLPIAIWGDGSAVRDYIHVSDVVAAVEAAMAYEGQEHVFNIGSGQGKSLLDVISAVEDATGYRLARKFNASRTFDVERNVLDISKAAKELNWRPKVTFEDGVGDMASWLAEELRQGNFSTPILR